MRNTEKKKLLSDVEIREIVGAGRAEDDVEMLNKESDEVVGDLQVVTEEEQNCVDVAEVCALVKNVLMFVGEEKKLGH